MKLKIKLGMSKVATRIEQGERETQQDAVSAHINGDGSWVIAVADGPGCGHYLDVAASIALSTLPVRIASEAEMGRAFAAANERLRRLEPSLEDKGLAEDLNPGTHISDTTMTVAAWTPEAGLLAAWVGDSIPMVFPSSGGKCWIGEPAEVRGCFFVGDCAVLESGEPSPTLKASMRRLSDTVAPADLADAASGGLTVAVMSDGAFNGWMTDEGGYGIGEIDWGEWGRMELYENGELQVLPCRDTTTSWLWHVFGPDCGENVYLNPSKRTLSKAQRTANFVLNKAKQHKLHDNTSVAVGLVPACAPQRDTHQEERN